MVEYCSPLRLVISSGYKTFIVFTNTDGTKLILPSCSLKLEMGMIFSLEMGGGTLITRSECIVFI
jgi:hypothetical protein